VFGYLTETTTMINYGLTLLLLTAAGCGYLIGKILEDAFK
jgi:hypothetical protein